jgi:3-hydroxyisobutyrate dehydrogenase
MQESRSEVQMVETIAKGGGCGHWTTSASVLKVISSPLHVEHFVKDMGIALAESRNMGIALPGLAWVEQLYIALKGAGQGPWGPQALVLPSKAECDA